MLDNTEDAVLEEEDAELSSSCARLIMTYAIETRAETIIKCLLRTTEMKSLRCTIGDILRDRIRNEGIRSIREIQDVTR